MLRKNSRHAGEEPNEHDDISSDITTYNFNWYRWKPWWWFQVDNENDKEVDWIQINMINDFAGLSVR